MSEDKKAKLAAELEANLPQYTGTESYTNLRYPWLNGKRFLLTDGAKYLAEKAGAFWLMDAIASHQINREVAAESMQFWKLVVDEDAKAILTCDDGNGKILVTQEIPYTNFPLAEIKLYVQESEYLAGLVVMLPSEY